MKKLLFTLQRKLIIMTFIFVLIFSSTIKRVTAEIKDFIRCRDFKLRNKLLKSNREMSAQYIYNIVKKQLNSVTETVNCKQLVLYMMMKELTIYKMALNVSSEALTDLI